MSAHFNDLEHIRVRFATYRDRTIAQRSADAAQLIGLPATERVLLDTCHRVELVTVDESAPSGRLVSGRSAVYRVFEVVAGFDSAVVAEEQLLGQARAAYETALADGSTGPILNELFRRALRFGRRVRTHARPGSDRSLADRGVAWLVEYLPDSTRVLVAGTGEMGRLAARRVAEAGHRVTLVSRSAERGGALLEQLPAGDHTLVIGELDAATVASIRGMVLAVRSRDPVVATAHVEATTPWIVDLSMPAAVSADAATLLGERLMTLDRLAEISGSTPVLAPDVEARLRAEMRDEAERFVTWLESRRHVDALAALHGEADEIRRRHLDRLRRRTTLDSEQLTAVEAASAAMLGELLHRPSVELRRGGADAETVRRLFGLDA